MVSSMQSGVRTGGAVDGVLPRALRSQDNLHLAALCYIDFALPLALGLQDLGALAALSLRLQLHSRPHARRRCSAPPARRAPV